MSDINNSNDKQPSFLTNLAKGQAKKQLKKNGLKAGKALIKMLMPICISISSAIGGVIVPVICIMMIPILAITAFYNAFNIKQYEQECPELVRIYLQDNFAAFEKKVNEYCHNDAFISFVCDSEFDNGYTKLVYGGTSAYMKNELSGNYNGVQGQAATWVTKNGDDYTAKSVLETVQEYIDAGVDVSKIKINDEYLKGYGEASGYGDKTSLSFDKWINYSYYTIPFYYHWNMAKNSQYESPYTFLGITLSGDNVGLPNWIDDKDEAQASWSFMDGATTEGAGFKGGNDWQTRIFSDATDVNYTNMTYKDYLKTGWTACKLQSNDYYESDSRSSDDVYNNTGYYAQGVMLGYKMEKDDFLISQALDKLWGRDVLYNYYPMSKYFVARDGYYNHGINDLYLYDWFNESADGNVTNYEKYLMNPTGISKIAKREKSDGTSILNSNVETWINSFAEYFAKEIYYIYPNRDYVVDYFMSDSVPDEKKIAFLQRSFYAMATGSELVVDLDEEYTIKNGTVGSVINGTDCGSLNINDLTVGKVELVGYYDYDTHGYDTEYCMETSDISDVEARIEEILNAYHKEYEANHFDITELNEIPYTITLLYNVQVCLDYSDDQETLYFLIPVANDITFNVGTKQIIDNSVIYNVENAKKSFNNELISKSKSKKYLSSIVKFDWDEDYYNAQYEYVADSEEKKENPLEGLENNIKFENYQTESDDWEGLIYTGFTAEGFKAALEVFCSGDNNPLYNMFNGTMKGNRTVTFTYSDHSFLNYDVNEVKDDAGNITKISIQIYTYYPDITKYDQETYRVAYGLENGDALNQALNLLKYSADNAGNTNILTDLNDNVDFSSLIIAEDDSYADTGAIYEDEDLYMYIADIIFVVESAGNWGAIAKPHNVTSSEKTITVGAYQFYGERGHKLLKAICKANETDAKSIIGTSLYDKIMSRDNWESSGFGTNGELSDIDYSNLTKLLKTDYGIDVQKEKMAESVEVYVEYAKNKGITDVKCQAYFSVMYHQRPESAYEVADLFKNSADKSLAILHKECLKNDVFSDYPSRYKKTYEMCQNILTMDVNGDIAKVLQYVQSSKVIGKPYGRSDLYSKQRYKPTYDCSELTYCAFYYGAGITIPVTAASQEEWCRTNATLICKGTQDTSKMMPGDLIFYAEPGSSTAKGDAGISHVAIYIGDDKVVEAGNPVGVYSAISEWHIDNYYATYRLSIEEIKKIQKQ